MDNQNYQSYNPASPNPSSTPAGNGYPQVTIMSPDGQPIPPTPATPPAEPPKKRNLGLIIALVLTSILAVVFTGLFIWANVNWETTRTDVEGQINKAVAIAVNDKTTELENAFIEREKNPYSTFSGPIDYGALYFTFPKTWSVYIEKDAHNGGDFASYFNPGVVYPLSDNNINALRVSILTDLYDNVIKSYESRVKSGKLSVNLRLINGENANVYTGELPNGGFIGAVAIFAIRDKTVVVQTDANVFLDDFYRILDTIQFTK